MSVVPRKFQKGSDEDITPVFLCLSLFLSLVVTLLCFSTSVISEKCPFVNPICRLLYFFIDRQWLMKKFQFIFLELLRLGC